MTVKLVVRVELCDMSSKIMYPIGEDTEERAALLTGIVQLVSVALKREEATEADLERPNFMKSDKGVIGYAQTGGFLYITECEQENEAGDVLRTILDAADLTIEQIQQRIEKVTRRRGSEISGLWGK